ncbi:histidine phosphatase family protein [Caballeronia sp. dw_276]|uniref:histidine phosphatase family protein n=1 Tax=Caballeronia sp. dw_276 TaxID=2719795 RepID=UPI001BD4D304|nr:histidine phosphatase family protein [Caballeronia sp. dw_276]
MRKTWWWVRHAPVTCFGEKIYGQLDLPCNCDDIALFDRAVGQLPEEALWVTTPLARTAQTRDALLAAAARRGLRRNIVEHRVEPRFAEQHLGTWQSCDRDEIDQQRGRPRHPYWLADPYECPPHGESFLSLSARVGKGVDVLQQSHGPKDIVAVAHAGTIRAALMNALALDASTALKVAIANCAVVCIELVDDGITRTGQLKI